MPPEARSLGQSLTRNTGEMEAGLPRLCPSSLSRRTVREVFPLLPSSVDAGTVPTQQAKADVSVAL